MISSTCAKFTFLPSLTQAGDDIVITGVVRQRWKPLIRDGTCEVGMIVVGLSVRLVSEKDNDRFLTDGGSRPLFLRRARAEVPEVLAVLLPDAAATLPGPQHHRQQHLSQPLRTLPGGFLSPLSRR